MRYRDKRTGEVLSYDEMLDRCEWVQMGNTRIYDAKEIAARFAPIVESPLLDRLAEAARTYEPTEAEIDAQRKSWVRGMTARCEHGIADFEQCGDCKE